MLLFLLSSAVAGLGAAPLLYAVHASAKLDIEVVLGGLFVILAAWIAVLVYRGAKIDDDVEIQFGARGPGEYLGGVGKTLGDNWTGCGDLGGCSTGSELDGIIGVIMAIVAILIIIFVVLPLVAWLAVEVVFPLAVLVVYGTLYHALAFAVNDAERFKGNLGGSLLRGLGFALLYTSMIALILGAFVGAFHGNLPSLHRF